MLAGAPVVGEAAGETMGEVDRQRHELGGLVGGVTKHHPLVARPLLLRLFLLRIHPLRDLVRLLGEGDEHGDIAVVERQRRVGVADLFDRSPGHGVEIHGGVGRDLAGEHQAVALGEDLAGDPAPRILFEAGIEDRVGDVVADLVGMALGDRLGGEDIRMGHRRALLPEQKNGRLRKDPPIHQESGSACAGHLVAAAAATSPLLLREGTLGVRPRLPGPGSPGRS